MKNKTKRTILLLKMDHTLVSMDERKLTERDLLESEYILVPSSANTRNYVLTKVSKYHWFDYATIKCQIGFGMITPQRIHVRNYILDPVSYQTTSLVDVVNVLSMIDQLNLINQVITDAPYVKSLMLNDNKYFVKRFHQFFEIMYFEVTLYRKNEIAYQKAYQNPEEDVPVERDLETNVPVAGYAMSISACCRLMDTGRVSKVFKKLYDGCANKLFHNEYVILDSDRTWKITSSPDTDGLVGIPLLKSNSITFGTSEEIFHLSRIPNIVITFSVHKSSQKMIDEIDTLIAQGQYDELRESISPALDYEFLSEYNVVTCHREETDLLDIVSHLDFLFYIMQTMISQASHTNDTKTQLHMIMQIGFNYVQQNNTVKYHEVFVSNSNMISARDFLQMLVHI